MQDLRWADTGLKAFGCNLNRVYTASTPAPPVRMPQISSNGGNKGLDRASLVIRAQWTANTCLTAPLNSFMKGVHRK